eukprot:CAMPEP_0113299004 /NCGR_PEP_ID=MMETSP0010_2-20120614/1212_1 /TAXON_ID=216773 ORGANISM="Corethron hystrix, Strain 308" /NCGR_SAMPLE_ID=MMETSP0010_2 /ASSEMBLY_ACC=CAM_ASM_000155 /LENGTH=120 /DNA_ID=CAMNT_0000152151 /DNA_START=24 /DNA_END=382 /DNA_ORIENTATION=- /assembly_acc=CAM_ASM_000155
MKSRDKVGQRRPAKLQLGRHRHHQSPRSNAGLNNYFFAVIGGLSIVGIIGSVSLNILHGNRSILSGDQNLRSKYSSMVGRFNNPRAKASLSLQSHDLEMEELARFANSPDSSKLPQLQEP